MRIVPLCVHGDVRSSPSSLWGGHGATQDLWGTGKLDMLILVEPRSQLRTLQEQSKPVLGRDWGPCLGLHPPGMGWVQMIVTMQVFPTWWLRGFSPFESWKIG